MADFETEILHAFRDHFATLGWQCLADTGGNGIDKFLMIDSAKGWKHRMIVQPNLDAGIVMIIRYVAGRPDDPIEINFLELCNPDLIEKVDHLVRQNV